MTMEAPRYDVIIRNASVLDGTGKPAFRADIAIRGERLAQIGSLELATATREIDVHGLTVAPGFIDVHAHDDAELISKPDMAPKLTQGVTTVIAGNCGISGAPYSDPASPSGLLRLVFKSDRFMARTFDQYLSKVRAAEPAINSAFLTGHSTLRIQVMGNDLNRTATAAEIAQMRGLLTDCLLQGSLGLSTGLFYPPARAASTREVIEIAAPLQAHQGVYVTHMRNEADNVIESLEESLEIGHAAGVPVVISHHKCMGHRNFGRSTETLALMDRARARQPVALDVYPYTAGSSVLHADLVAVASKTLLTWCDPYPEYTGRDLSEVATELGCTPIEAVARLEPAGAVYFFMDEADIVRIMRSPEAMIGSDGMPADQHPHPRLWGTFPRVLGRYVREQNVLPLPEAVHRMTGLAAQRFGLRDRGIVEVGNYADLCIFDPDSILDAATFEQPTQPAIGIHYVFVNGQMALEQGKLTAARAGKVLTRGLH
jgi:N-acyl-D-amino-acid deacylase